MNRTIAVSVTAALVAASGVVASQPAGAAKTYTACVKKSTGEVRLLLGKSKKCKKGWKKTKWTKSGPQGAKGPDGPTGSANSLGTVVDGTGAVVGQSMGSPGFPYLYFSVLIDGGAYTYSPNGWLIPVTAPPYYDNASCTGTPFVAAADTEELGLVRSDSTLRVVYRPSTPALGAASAYRLSGEVTSVLNASQWYLNDSGTCTAGGAPFTGYRLPLTSVPAPPDRPGPLKVV
jgi:hypothetical protein